ncbi:TerD family protein [Aneurinibacillus migulanus]|uniref:TerD family protein n=1 Tax=Aneurinibacillus migulanus TaxID=47500 RepID=UPI002E1F2B8D|nr:TerD family protein [Aneurinibacillus migulanus]
MTLTLIKGQKTDITKKNPALNQISIGFGWSAQNGIDLDVSVFLLGADGKVIQEDDFVFYGNPSGANGAVIHNGNNGTERSPDNEQIKIALSLIPNQIQKIAFTMTIYDAIIRNQNFGQVNNSYMRMIDQAQNTEIIRFEFGSFTIENAIVIGELYRHNGEWKFNAIGAGFEGGLAALCKNFGIEVDEASASIPATQFISEVRQATPLQERIEPASPPINLTKVELKKKGDVISLKKVNKKLGEISINLNWKQKAKQSIGFLGFGNKQGIDLDVGCLIEMKDGGKTAIQALGDSFGYYNDYPFIELDGDDRTGAVTVGENIRINGDYIYEFKRILVYAFIYDGVANWSQADGIVTIKQADNPEIIVRLDSHENRKGMCAIALIENINNETFSIKKVVQYFKGHREMDQAFNWGLRWQAGSKD